MNPFSSNNLQNSRSFLDAESVPDKKTTLILFFTLAFGLWIDRVIPLWGQIIAGVMTWVLFLAIYRKMPENTQHLLMSCLVIATMGEIFCSLIWQLYDYRLLNIPFYVPPGHVIVFLLGSALAPRMPKLIVWAVPMLVAPYVILGYFMGFDEFGIILFAMFFACLIAEKDRRLYATMFMLCLMLEIYGTLLGNWTWKADVPIWGLRNTNPPLAAGAFYCVLDFLMLRAALAFWASRNLYRIHALRFRQYLYDFVHSFTGYAPQPKFVLEKSEEEKKEKTPRNLR